MNLHGKTAVITGAANGLGAALAKELYKQHCHLALIDIDTAGLQKVAANMQDTGLKISLHTVDISSEPAVAAVVEQIIEMHGQVDILINNAAICHSIPFGQLEMADYRRLLDINFWGTVYCTRYLLPHLERQTKSRLVNIISAFAYTGLPGKTAYASSKAAIMAFTKSLRVELAGTGVKASLVIPPPMDTQIVRAGKHTNAKKKANEIRFMQKNGMETGEVARRIARKIKTGKFRIVVGVPMFLADVAARLFPTLFNKLTSRYRNSIDFY